MRIQDKHIGSNILIAIGVLSILINAPLIFGLGIIFAALAYRLAKKRILSENPSKTMLIVEIGLILISVYFIFLIPSKEFIYRYLYEEGVSPIFWLITLIAYFYMIILAKKDNELSQD